MEAINQKTVAGYAEATRQANATGQQIVVEVDARLKSMGSDIQQIKSAPVMSGSQQTLSPGQGSSQDVVSPKECPVGKLSDGCTVEDFRQWCESVEKHLESHRT